MDVFGPSWENHAARIEENWRGKITPSDTVLIPGDISWGISLDEALADLKFIDSLPGTKILSKGNHDYWWGTTKKVEDFLASNDLRSIRILKNNGYCVEDTLIAGARGWLVPENPEYGTDDERIYLREVGRLERSLKDSEAAFIQVQEALGKDTSPKRRIAMLHYPPIYDPKRDNELTSALEKHGVDICLYGHLHGRAHKNAFEGVRNGVEYRLISADYLKFDPVEI